MPIPPHGNSFGSKDRLKERMLGQHQKLGDGVGDDLVIERPDCSATSRDC